MKLMKINQQLLWWSCHFCLGQIFHMSKLLWYILMYYRLIHFDCKLFDLKINYFNSIQFKWVHSSLRYVTEDMLMTFWFSSNRLNTSRNFVIILIIVSKQVFFLWTRKKIWKLVISWCKSISGKRKICNDCV